MYARSNSGRNNGRTALVFWLQRGWRRNHQASSGNCNHSNIFCEISIIYGLMVLLYLRLSGVNSHNVSSVWRYYKLDRHTWRMLFHSLCWPIYRFFLWPILNILLWERGNAASSGRVWLEYNDDEVRVCANIWQIMIHCYVNVYHRPSDDGTNTTRQLLLWVNNHDQLCKECQDSHSQLSLAIFIWIGTNELFNYEF